jgi:twitching motility two-component system response regulator PilH
MWTGLYRRATCMRPTVLFADDDPLMHLLYKGHVERAGYCWISATNGREAIEVAVREVPQLAVMDVVMPEMDGLSALLKLKQAETTKTIPVLVITSDPNYSLRQREFAGLGAAAFLNKPFSPAQLLEAIHRILPSSA